MSRAATPTRPAGRATPAEIAAWILVIAGLGAVFWLHLVPALVAGLFVHVVLQRLAGVMAGRRVSRGAAKLLALALIGLIGVGTATGGVLLLVGLARGHVGDIPGVFQRMAETLEQTQVWLARQGAPALIPEAARDTAQIKDAVTSWLREHAAELQKTGGEAGRMLLHAAIGMAIGVLIFFRRPAERVGPLALALSERVRRLDEAFSAIVFAQVKISAVNTALTALYLLVGLPLFGVRLPLASTIVAMTFVTGLLPVVGNLLSNTVIVVISLGVSPWVAAVSLVFLVVIHKLEYFINARLVGAEVHAAAWEILLAVFLFEAAFGIPGVILAPIVYAYAKQELMDRGLV